jgi:hypothetical protein
MNPCYVTPDRISAYVNGVSVWDSTKGVTNIRLENNKCVGTANGHRQVIYYGADSTSKSKSIDIMYNPSVPSDCGKCFPTFTAAMDSLRK